MIDFSIRRPFLVLLIATIVTLSAAPGLPRLRLHTDGHALVPHGAPEFRIDERIRAEFGILDPVVVLISTANRDGVFNRDTLRFVRDATEAVAAVAGVTPATVTSLSTEVGFRHQPNSLKFATLLDPLPEDQSDIARLRDDVRKIRLYTGSIVSFDEKSTAVYVGTPTGCDRVRFFTDVQVAIQRLSVPTNDRIQVIGAPVAEALLGLHILEDLGIPPKLLGASTFGETETDEFVEGESDIAAVLFAVRRFISRRIGLLPVTILLMTLVFAVGFRRSITAVVPMLEVGACLFFVFGLMGLVGVPIYLTIAVVPIILTAAGVCDEIHLLSCYRRHVHAAGGAIVQPEVRRAVVRDTMREMAGPIMRTSLTTAVGFASFIWAPIEPVRMFGVITAFGVVFCMVWSLTVMPAILTIIHPRRLVRSSTRNVVSAEAGAPFDLSGKVTGGPFARLAELLMRRRSLVVPAFGLLLIGSTFGIRKVVVQDSWIDGFDPHSEFRHATAEFNEQFFGTHVLQLCVDASKRTFEYTADSGTFEDHRYPLPAHLLRSPGQFVGDRVWLSSVEDRGKSSTSRPDDGSGQRWRSSIESIETNGVQKFFRTPRSDGLPIYVVDRTRARPVRIEIGDRPMTSPRVMAAVRSLGELVRGETRYAVGGVLDAADYIETSRYMIRPDEPDSRTIPQSVDEIESLWSKYAFIRGPQRQRQLVDSNYSRALTTVYLRNANFVDTAQLMRHIRAFEREKLAPAGISLEFAGDVAVSQALIDGIVSTQVKSLVFSLVGIFLVTCLMGRSWLYGLYCVLPCALSLPIVFAAMGWMGIPLGVATSMFAAMILGAGVDFAIHVLDRFRAIDASPEIAVKQALVDTGFPVTVNAMALSAGMLVLTLSQVPANARLGFLLAVGLLSCLFVSLLLLPVLLKWRPLTR